MSIQRMPNGQLVDIADGTPPDVVARIRSQYAAKSGSPTASANSTRPTSTPPPPQKSFLRQMGDNLVESGKNFIEAPYLPFGTPTNVVHGVQRGLSLNTVDPLKSAIEAGVAAIRGKDSFSHAYTQNQDAAHAQAAQDRDQHPITTSLAEIGGSLVMPVGPIGGGLARAARFAPGIAKALAEAKGVGTAVRLARSPVGVAARTGVTAGGLSALGNTIDKGDYENVAGNIGEGALAGGIFGGVLGSGGQVARRLSQMVADHSPENAANVAYTKIADMLGRAKSDFGHGPSYTPESAQLDMAISKYAGNEPMLADLSPEMQRAAGYLARKPGAPEANDLVIAGEDRAASAADRFNEKLRQLVNPEKGHDARAASAEVNAQRKTMGEMDYAPGGAMDTEIPHIPELQKFLDEAPPVTQKALRDGYMDMLNRREVPAQTATEGVFTHIPNMRTLDYFKRALDREVTQALAAKDMPRVQAASAELTQLKKILDDANPEYMDILGRQRDAFQEMKSLENGQNFIKKMRTATGPRELLEMLAHKNTKIEDVRTGMIDALTHMDHSTDNPVALMRKMMKAPEQRQVMLQLFGGTKELNLFDRFMRRELRAGATNNLLARGKQSATNELNQAADVTEGSAAAMFANAVARGGAFGGAVGAGSAGLAKFDQLSRGMGPQARAELAKILMGQGEGLPQGVKAARDAALKRRRSDRQAAKYAGRIGGALIGSQAQE